MVGAGQSHSRTLPAGHLLGHQPETVPKAVRSCPLGSRGMKKVDFGLAASSLRWVGGPALQPLQLAQAWPEVLLLADLGRAALRGASSPFFGEEEAPEGPTKACVHSTQPVTLPGTGADPGTPARRGGCVGPGGPSTGLQPLSVGFTHGGSSPPSVLRGLIPCTGTALAFCNQRLKYLFIFILYPNSKDELLQLITLKRTANLSSIHLNFSIKS